MGVNKIRLCFLKRLCSPCKYARAIGVNFGKNCVFHKSIIWGSEPYLIKIGDNVRITAGVKFITHDGGVWVLRNLYGDNKIDVFGGISIGNNCNIGWDAIIMPGVKIGDNCVIGAGAVVTKDIPDNSIAVGVPAKVIETVNEYYKKVKLKCDYTKGMSANDKKKYLLNKYYDNVEENK